MNNRVGCKIYSNKDERKRIGDILASQPKENPIEIGFYNKDGQYGLDDEFLEILETRFNDFPKKIIHLSIKNVLFSYGKTEHEWLKGLDSELAMAQKVGGMYGIIHDTKWPACKRERKKFIKIIAQNAKILKEYTPLPLYMENTFEGIDFYREFFDVAENSINFCFDIGHTRVWSEDGYKRWRRFLRELRDDGIKLHFHIHTNNYVYDEHLSFFEKTDKESVSFIKELIAEFDESYFILEIQRDFKECIELFCK